jgi:hypothetical protein
MSTVDFGLKYHGWALDGEYFMRWLNQFQGPGTAGLPQLYDRGYQLQASYMVIPSSVQLYVGGSTIHGKYGDPYDIRLGVNVYPFKNKVLRWDTEALYLYKSATGATALPYSVGGTGVVFHTTIERAL